MLEPHYHQWILDNLLLFRPSNKGPNEAELRMVFEIANELDRTQNHRFTNCARCYYNAKRVLQKYIDLNINHDK